MDIYTHLKLMLYVVDQSDKARKSVVRVRGYIVNNVASGNFTILRTIEE